MVKINIDGAFRDKWGTGGWGPTAKDSAADSIFAAAGSLKQSAWLLMHYRQS
jgi:ribonuclease HI